VKAAKDVVRDLAPLAVALAAGSWSLRLFGVAATVRGAVLVLGGVLLGMASTAALYRRAVLRLRRAVARARDAGFAEGQRFNAELREEGLSR
jgi:hypothetical protein